MFTPSLQQAEFFTWLTTASGNGILAACAGSGKTTTVFEGFKLLPKILEGTFMPPKIVYIAFAADIVAAAKARAARGVEVVTCHALGRRALVSLVPDHVSRSRDWVKGNKLQRRLYDILGDCEDVRDAVRLGSIARSQYVMPADMNSDYLHALAEHFGFVFSEPSAVYRAVQKAVTMGAENLTTIDFDEMLYLPIILNCKFEPQDYVFVDEAQDMNDIQLEILSRLGRDSAGSPTRYIFVGDACQAIYAFRGANADSMEKISERFHCKSMPLSVSFRCPQAVVAEAQKFLNIGGQARHQQSLNTPIDQDENIDPFQ